MKKKNQPSSFWDNAKFPVAVAHRGGDGAGIEKENSLKAFKAAYMLGYRWFETDVVPTRDGKLLAIHGRGYQRHPNKDLPSRLKVQRMTYDQVIRSFKVGGEKLVTLDELLDAFPDVKFFLDPKTIKAAPALAKNLVRRPQDISRVWVGSFIPFNNSRVYRTVKKQTGQEVGLAILGPFKSLPIIFASQAPWLGVIAQLYIRWTRAGSVRIPFSWLDSNRKINKIVELSHKLDLILGVYTPNTKEEIQGSIDHGADVIMSDNVKLLRSII